jgi:hypothetical protein
MEEMGMGMVDDAVDCHVRYTWAKKSLVMEE